MGAGGGRLPALRRLPAPDRPADPGPAGRAAELTERRGQNGNHASYTPVRQYRPRQHADHLRRGGPGQRQPGRGRPAMELIIEHGINHIDTAASYGDAELRLGPWMETHRDQFFLATKTGKRTRAEAYEEIQRSLERLRTDHVDLIQLHNLVDEDEWETAFATGGAIEAVVEAQADGLVRYIGVTGHGVTVARPAPALAGAVPLRLGAAAVQLPDVAERRRTSPTSRRWSRSAPSRGWPCRRSSRSPGRRGATGSRRPAPGTSRSPTRPRSTPRSSWVLGREGVFLNTVGDITLLPKVLDAAERFTGRPGRRADARAGSRLRPGAALRLSGSSGARAPRRSFRPRRW